ncbi:unnamed protein product [Polarella glacialis]|uniref:Leucine-binding protein domain-containing protein n=1 Tax=Polarella glacialis TaxID=89957 RepID=A0A813E3C4_POLGL|nr:unnamed protein product [Polarella glacialis]
MPDFTSLEGYIVGRFLAKIMSDLWSTIPDLNMSNTSNFSGLREGLLDHVYTEGIIHLGSFRLGPFGLPAPQCLYLGSGCGCNQGMRRVFTSQILPDGSFEDLPALGFDFAACGYKPNTWTMTLGQTVALKTLRGQQLYNGTLAAIAKVNKDGYLGGVRLELLALDDSDDSLTAQTNTDSLIMASRVFAIVSSGHPDTANSMLEEAYPPAAVNTSTQALMIGIPAGSPKLRSPFNRNVVNVRASYGEEATAIVRYFVDTGPKVRRVGAFCGDGPFGVEACSEFNKALKTRGLAVVSQVNFSTPSSAQAVKDAAATMTASGPEAPELVILAGSAEPASRFVAFAKKLWPLCLFAAFASVGSEELGALLSLQNISKVFMSQVVPDPLGSSLIATSFRDDLASFDPLLRPEGDALEGYLNTMMLVEVLRASLPEVGRAVFLDQIYKTGGGFISAFGTRFGEWKDGVSGLGTCSQGLRQVWISRLAANGSIEYKKEYTLPQAMCESDHEECIKGYYRSDPEETCKECSPGSYTDGTNCSLCPPGKYGSSPSDSSYPCVLCQAGDFSSTGGQTTCSTCTAGLTNLSDPSACLPCESGTMHVFNNSSNNNSNQIQCVACGAGRFSTEGSIICIACGENSVAKERSGRCDECSPGTSTDILHIECNRNVFFWAGQVVLSIFLVAVFCLLPKCLGLPVHILNVSREGRGGHVVVTTNGPHFISKRLEEVMPIQVRCEGTGHPELDAVHHGSLFSLRRSFTTPFTSCRGASFQVRVLGWDRLELRSLEGTQLLEDFQASQGTLRPVFPTTMLRTGFFHIPFFVIQIKLVIIIVLIYAFNLSGVSSDLGEVLCGVGIAIVLAILITVLQRRLYMKTPLSRRLKLYRMKLAKENPYFRVCPRGPGRAITEGQLADFYAFFADFIQERNMYYTDANLVKPLTAEQQLSFAELAGPSQVQYFVSHYWGTPFKHFCESIELHAQSVATMRERNPIKSRRSTGSLKSLSDEDIRKQAYWICSLSNNQWSVSEELGHNWDESSFYLTLRSGFCLGTAMVIDSDALPLTRSWCLFEVLQTFLLMTEDEHFQGLQMCTASGVLNFGCTGVDVSMALATRLASLRLEDASASRLEDKLMIEGLVQSMPGGFRDVNVFVRRVFREALYLMKSGFEADFDRLTSMLEQVANVAGQEEMQSKGSLLHQASLHLESCSLKRVNSEEQGIVTEISVGRHRSSRSDLEHPVEAAANLAI